VQYAVDPEAHAQVGLGRLQVDVRGSVLDRLSDQQVYVLDNRRVLDDLLDLGEVVFLLLGVQRLGEVVEVGVGAVVAVDGRGDVCAGRDDGLDVHAGQRPDVVDREHVCRVGHRDEQLAVLEADGDGRVAAAHRPGHAPDG
jgi:hypothetical protein